MAGGTGFEPVLAESESAVLPLDDPPFEIGDIGMKLDYTLPPKITMGAANSAFRVLRPFAGFSQSDLFTFYLA